MSDALDYEGFDEFSSDVWRTPEGILYALELFNGMGYRRYHPQVNTPYLWSGTNHYGTSPSIGKYTSDGRWNVRAISRQTGAAAIMLAGRWP